MLTDAVALRPKIDLSGSNVGQEALKRVFNQSDYRKHVLYEPLDWFNGYDKPHGKPSRDTPPVTPGDLLVAFPEENGDRKFDVMNRWLARLGNEETFDALQIPLSKLTLSSRINDYWTRMRTAKGIVQEASDFEDKDYQDIKDPVVIEDVESTRQKLLSALQEVAFETETIQQGIKDLELALQTLHHGMQNDEHAFSSEAVGGTLELEAKGDKQQEVSQKDSHNAEESDLQERPKTQKGKTEQVEPVAQARQPKEPEKEGQEEAWHENQIARADGVAADEEEQEGDWHKIQVARAKEAAKKHG